MTSVDVSHLLLIEDSADSEDDYSGFFTLCLSSIAGDNAEDDAESCNCDTVSICCLSKDGECYEDDEGFDEFCDGGNNSKMWISVGAFGDEAETRMGEVNSVTESEDRLFWETCMAVGYP